jgi:hypothetical protein
MSTNDFPESLRFVSEHFLILSARYFKPGEEARPGFIGHYFAASGFVLDFGGEWVLITAGHVLSGIEDAKQAGCRFVDWHLDDTFALSERRPVNVDGPGAQDTVPFGFESVPFLCGCERVSWM